MTKEKKILLKKLPKQYKASKQLSQSIIKLSDGTYEIKQISFLKFKQLLKRSKYEGIVLLGAGGNLQQWVNGITDLLNQQEISKGDIRELFSGLYLLKTTGGRNDLAMLFNKNGQHNIGKMAMWRLRFGNCSWASDYINNYADQHEI